MFFVIAVAAILLMALVYLDTGIIKNSNRFYRQEIEALAGSDILEYVPKSVSIDWLKHKSGENPQRLVNVPGTTEDAEVKLLKWGPVHRAFTIKLSQGSNVRLRTFYYPGWQCSIDGRPAEIKPETQSGAILVNVPGGEHKISVDFLEGTSQRAGRLISAVSALAGLILYFGVMRRPRQTSK